MTTIQPAHAGQARFQPPNAHWNQQVTQQQQQQQQQQLGPSDVLSSQQAMHALPQQRRQQSALHEVLQQGSFASTQEQLFDPLLQSSQQQGFGQAMQRSGTSAFCQGFPPAHTGGSFQPSFRAFGEGSFPRPQQADISTASQWASALQQQQQTSHQAAVQGAVQNPWLEANLALLDRASAQQPQSGLFPQQVPRSLSIAQQYQPQQFNVPPSDALDTAFRHAMQGHADPWSSLLQMTPAMENPQSAGHDLFAGTQIPGPYSSQAQHTPITSSGGLPPRLQQLSGPSQMQSAQQSSQMLSMPSIQPTSD